MELRYKIASPDKMQHNLAQVNKILAKSYEECIKTIDNIRIPSVLSAAEYIRKAKRIFIVGCGVTYLVVQNLNFNCNAKVFPCLVNLRFTDAQTT